MDRIFFLLVLCLQFSISIGSNYQLADTDEDNGGHSFEFKPKGYDWKMADLGYTPELIDEIHTLSKRKAALPLDDTERNVEDRVSFNADFEEFYSSLPEVMKSFEVDLERVLGKHRIVGIVTGRIKSLSSLKGKMEKDGITDFRQVTDIVGLRVTLQTLDDILKFKEKYLGTFNDSINEIRCYGVCGPALGSSDPRAKIYWPWKGSGYRRLHFKVAIPELETAGEIQVGTPYMTLWADWEHELVYKGPKKFQQNSDVKEYAQRLAKYYMTLDDVRNGMSPECPRILKKAKPKKIFGIKKWRLFGSSYDACNVWNDLRTNMP